MPLAAQIVYTILDDSGERGTTAINLPNAFSIAQFGEFGAGMATLLDALIGGRVDSAEICFGIDISTLTSNVATANSDVEELGRFMFETDIGTQVRVNLPGIDELVVAPGSDDIDQGDTAVAAFITVMEDGISTGGGTVTPCDVGEQDIITTVFAREGFRASGSRR